MLKIVFTGVESTGKSTLVKAVGAELNAIVIEEYARTYLEEKGANYDAFDLLEIAHCQALLEKTAQAENTEYLVCDTSFLVLKIWYTYKYGHCHKDILKYLKEEKADIYFLCGIDIPWEDDPLRENPNEREELHKIYQQELKALNVPYYELKGTVEERLKQVRSIFETFEKPKINNLIYK